MVTKAPKEKPISVVVEDGVIFYEFKDNSKDIWRDIGIWTKR